MLITLETPEKNAIQAFDTHQLLIDGQTYTHTVVVNAQRLDTYAEIATIDAIDEAFVATLLDYAPELVILGSNAQGLLRAMDQFSALYAKQIGIECMTLAAACRTYNLLLSEKRAVVGVFLL